jgi:Acyl-CoA dehydrogenase, C-terminal domain
LNSPQLWASNLPHPVSSCRLTFRGTIIGLSAAAISGVTLDIARHAIDILSEVARVKVGLRTQQVITQHAVLQADLGRAEGPPRSGRALLYQTLDEVWQVAAAGRR